MVDLHADDVESDEEPPELTDSEDSDVSGCNSEIPDCVLGRKVRNMSHFVYQSLRVGCKNVT